MKVAISVPDRIFEDVEAVVRRLKTTRSDVYVRALQAYLGDHAPDRVTAQLNAVIDRIGDDDSSSAGAIGARQIRKHSEW